jgi:hypothetical protein
MDIKEAFIPVTLKVRKFIPKGKRVEGGPEFDWVDYDFNLANINRWRPYVGEEENGQPNLFTMLYMKGDPNGSILGISGEEFLRQCRQAVIKWSEEIQKEKGAS